MFVMICIVSCVTPSPRTPVGGVEYLRTGGRWRKPLGRLVLFPRTDDGILCRLLFKRTPGKH